LCKLDEAGYCLQTATAKTTNSNPPASAFAEKKQIKGCGLIPKDIKDNNYKMILHPA